MELSKIKQRLELLWQEVQELEASGGTPTDCYTKAQTDALLAEKADISSLADVATSGNYSDLTNKPTLGTAAAKDMDTTLNSTSTNPVENRTLTSKFFDLDANLSAIRVMIGATLYGFRINKNDPDPSTRVEYLYDNANFAPAAMDFTEGEFDYGDWANAWFITGNKPVALRYNGDIDYYLDPNDYTKQIDGSPSDIANTAYAGNFMATMPTVWIKRWEDGNYQYFAFSDKQVNPDFKAYAHDAGDGFINDYIYLPMFKGTIIDTYLRSIADQYPTVNNTATVDRTAAVQCGTGWDMWAFSARILINDLLTLISKTTNCQNSFGLGKERDSNDASGHEGMLKTGLDDLDTGQFYGTDDTTHHVKVFHIEDYWGERFERSVGLHLVDNKYMYKLTPPYISSGSTSTYTLTNLDAPGAGYPTDFYLGDFGLLPKTIGGSTSTYFCDYFNSTSTGTRTAMFSGFYENEYNNGYYYLSVGNIAGATFTTLGASPCYNPPHST